MRKRIVEITFASGKKEYRVETAVRLFGITLLWAVDASSDPNNPERKVPAVFRTFEEACAHCGLEPGRIVNKKTVVMMHYDEV